MGRVIVLRLNDLMDHNPILKSLYQEPEFHYTTHLADGSLDYNDVWDSRHEVFMSNFVVRQIFFCGGNEDEFKKWRKGLDDQVKRSARKEAEHTLRIEIDEDAFDRLYGFQSHPIAVGRAGQRIAVRLVSQFGEESMKVVGV